MNQTGLSATLVTGVIGAAVLAAQSAPPRQEVPPPAAAPATTLAAAPTHVVVGARPADTAGVRPPSFVRAQSTRPSRPLDFAA